MEIQTSFDYTNAKGEAKTIHFDNVIRTIANPDEDALLVIEELEDFDTPNPADTTWKRLEHMLCKGDALRFTNDYKLWQTNS